MHRCFGKYVEDDDAGNYQRYADAQSNGCLKNITDRILVSTNPSAAQMA